MQKMLLTMENTESAHTEKPHTELGTYYDVKSLVFCAENNALCLWHNNQAIPLKHGDTILYETQRLKVHFIEERQPESATQNLTWLSPLQADVRHQHALLPNSNSNSLSKALDPLAFLSPTHEAPNLFAPLPASQQAPTLQTPAPHYIPRNSCNKPKLLSRLKTAGKKLWQSTTPGTNQW